MDRRQFMLLLPGAAFLRRKGPLGIPDFHLSLRNDFSSIPNTLCRGNFYGTSIPLHLALSSAGRR